MSSTDAQKRASIKYKKSHYKRVPLDVTPAKYDEIKSAAGSCGESVNGYIKKAIDMRLAGKAKNDSV